MIYLYAGAIMSSRLRVSIYGHEYVRQHQTLKIEARVEVSYAGVALGARTYLSPVDSLAAHPDALADV